MQENEDTLINDPTRDERYSSELQRRGVSKQFYDSNATLTCPECGNSFNLFYSRAKYCTGCPESIKGCQYARCTHCDTEFPFRSFMSKKSSKITSNYLGSIIQRYHNTFGERPGR